MLLKYGLYVLVFVMVSADDVLLPMKHDQDIVLASADDVLLPMNYGKDMMPTADCTPSPCPEDEDPPPMLSEKVRENQTVFVKVDDSILAGNSSLVVVEENSTVLVKWEGYSGYVNGWRQSIQYGHNFRDRLLTGMYSYHSNRQEDRRFNFRYRTWTVRYPGMMKNSRWWNGWTGWDASWSYARSDSVMLALWSYYHASYRDRRFNVLWQRINKPKYFTHGAYFTGWSWWDSVQNHACTTHAWMMGLYSYHNNGREDRRFNTYCQRIARKNPCSSNPCRSRGRCTQGRARTLVNDYRCSCYAGYQGTRSCTDINECTKKTHKCGKANKCTNTVGGYRCTCGEGYTGTGSKKCTGRYVTKGHLVPIPANGKKYGQ